MRGTSGTPRRTKRSRYRCSLPGLAGFAGLRRTEPEVPRIGSRVTIFRWAPSRAHTRSNDRKGSLAQRCFRKKKRTAARKIQEGNRNRRYGSRDHNPLPILDVTERSSGLEPKARAPVSECERYLIVNFSTFHSVQEPLMRTLSDTAWSSWIRQLFWPWPRLVCAQPSSFPL
jgi:hypothetical protein